MTEIGSFGGKLNAACAINSAGQVTGYSQDENGNLLAFVFSRDAPIASAIPSLRIALSRYFSEIHSLQMLTFELTFRQP
jgi:probable HAF family extracellular repeat protein